MDDLCIVFPVVVYINLCQCVPCNLEFGCICMMGKFMHHHCAATAEVAAQTPEQPAFQPWLVR